MKNVGIIMLLLGAMNASADDLPNETNSVTFNAYYRTLDNNWTGPLHPDALKLKSEAEKACASAQAAIQEQAKSFIELGLDPSAVKVVPEVYGFREQRSTIGSGGDVGYRCDVTVELNEASGFTLYESKSEEFDYPEQCAPILKRNKKNRKVIYQNLNFGWSILDGHWCNVYLIELMAK